MSIDTLPVDLKNPLIVLEFTGPDVAQYPFASVMSPQLGCGVSCIDEVSALEPLDRRHSPNKL